MKKYKLKVKHDTGTVIITTIATSEQAAREIVCKAEGCPDSAIVRVTEAKITMLDVFNDMDEELDRALDNSPHF